MAWKIKFSARLKKDFRRIGAQQLLKIKAYLEKVKALDNPRKLGKPLKSRFKGLWRYRVGDYRLVCEIQDQDLIVLVVRVASRKEVYNR
ncbi:type II toxin-antitoxin system RelE family toxin [Bathymodiolus septemdierum thioautotrophic gill symbiont]|uniref:Addiction module toxin, RelE/StbE family n=1 Tax=endosymbiont of Bathymodiolus septemdierum str. Myojin knoll TaxID=1303921 RepID=A0A0P0UTA3_9GAMM|nr:type II toxin-antitoxin system RelE/ParE family toxin [Bathymodiolus septemdierum thioautotrophic gill symbiont]BAS68165.1 addiction module toxin, RelE/StbE family [endosymbiont of Bathymodiolus septemdierum str. Myojin knoll]